MTSRPITMAKAAPHGPGEMVSSSLIGWNTSCHLYRMHTAHSKKVDTCIAPPIHVSGHGARHMQRPKVAPEAPGRGHHRARAARPRSSRRRPRATRRGSALAARARHADRARDRCQTRGTSRKRAAQRSKGGAVSRMRSLEHASARVQDAEEARRVAETHRIHCRGGYLGRHGHGRAPAARCEG